MNNELLQKLKVANQICNKAEYHYLEAADIERKIREGNTKLTVHFWISVAIGILVASIVGGISFEMGCVVGLIVGVIIYKRKKAVVKKAQDERLRKISKEKKEAQKIFEENANKLAFLPMDYWYPMATSYMVKVVQSGRANTLNEALSMFDEQSHRWKVEHANEQILAQQREQLADLAALRRDVDSLSGRIY